MNWFKKKAQDPKQDQKDQPVSVSMDDILGRIIERNRSGEDLSAMTFQERPGSIAMDGMNNQYNLNLTPFNSVVMSYYANTSCFLGYNNLSLLAQHPIMNRACVMKGEDSVKNGWSISPTSDEEISEEILTEISTLDDDYKTRHHLITAEKFKNVFGIRHVLFKVDSSDPDFYLKPFNPDSVTAGSYKGMHQVDPIYITPELTSDGLSDPLSENFMKPMYWVVGGQKIHRSHFVIIYGPEVADNLKPTYRYGGISLVQQTYERLYKAERTANEAPELALTKRSTVHKMDVKQLSLNPDLLKVMNDQQEIKNNFGKELISSEDDIIQLDTSLADYTETVMNQYQLFSGYVGIPFLKLLQTSPVGLNATGSFEEKSYNESVGEVQGNNLDPILNAHYMRVLRSDVFPKFNIQPFEFEIVWSPIDNPTSKDRAANNLVKAQTDETYFNIGAVTAEDIREKLSQDEQSEFNGVSPFLQDDQVDQGDDLDEEI